MQTQAATKPKRRRTVKPAECNAKNLVKQIKNLLIHQTIETILQFYTPALVAIIEQADLELKAIIREAASRNSGVADLCRMVDLENSIMASTEVKH